MRAGVAATTTGAPGRFPSSWREEPLIGFLRLGEWYRSVPDLLLLDVMISRYVGDPESEFFALLPSPNVGLISLFSAGTGIFSFSLLAFFSLSNGRVSNLLCAADAF